MNDIDTYLASQRWNWLKNLSRLWSPKERRLQRGLAKMHGGIRDQLLPNWTQNIDWGEDTDSADDYLSIQTEKIPD